MNRSILVFSLTPGYGGGEKYICDLITNLYSTYKWYLAVCSHEIVDKLSPIVGMKKIKVIRNNGINSRIMSAFSAVEFAIRNKLNIVVLNGVSEIRYALLFKLWKVKSVGMIHTLQIDSIVGPRRSQYLFSLKKCNSVISVSKQATYHYPKEIRKEMNIIYNCAPPPALNFGNITVNGGIRKALYVGRVENLKGIEDIYALAGIFQSVQFDLLGALGGGIRTAYSCGIGPQM